MEEKYRKLNEFTRIKTENQIPKQWQLTTVKSIHKGGVKKNIQENQRAARKETKINSRSPNYLKLNNRKSRAI